MQNHITAASPASRIGFALIAVGLSIALVFLAFQTQGNYDLVGETPQTYTGGKLIDYSTLPQRSFASVCCASNGEEYATPQQRVTVSLTNNTQSITAYILSVNSGELDSWVNATFGPGALASSTPSVVYLNAYLISHPSQIQLNFTVPANGRRSLDYYPSDIGPIMIALANSNYVAINYTYAWLINGIAVPPSTGINAMISLTAGGAGLSVADILSKRYSWVAIVRRRQRNTALESNHRRTESQNKEERSQARHDRSMGQTVA